MTTYHFYSPKGGQGCTVTAAAFALRLGRADRVAIVDTLGDMPAVLGLPQPCDGVDKVPVTAQIDLFVTRPSAELLAKYAHVVYDAGLPPTVLDGYNIMVVRPCYLALRRAIALTTPDQIIMVNEPNRALRADDVSRAIGAPVTAIIEYDPQIARAVDAGLLAARTPQSLTNPLRPLEVVS